MYLNTLALAYFQTGAADEAVKTEEQALAMLPPVASGAKPTGLRSEIEGHIAEFRQTVLRSPIQGLPNLSNMCSPLRERQHPASGLWSGAGASRRIDFMSHR